MMGLKYTQFVTALVVRPFWSTLRLGNISLAIRGVATGGISVYIPPKSVYLKKILCVCFSLVAQDKFYIAFRPHVLAHYAL